MSTNETDSDSEEEINWDEIVDQIFGMVGKKVAIIDQYGIILASKIPEYRPQTLVAPVIWDFMLQRDMIRDQLNVKEVQSLVVETDQYNLVFTFANYIYLLSQVEKSADLAQFMLTVDRIIKTLDKSKESPLWVDFEKIHLTDHFTQLQTHVEDNIHNERYPIFKQIVKYMRKKK
jgi:predicted regulator of Ras-like GTPase activity (Roadblock/LC7/MglB family)